MNERTLKTLEFQKIIARVAEFADTSFGKELVEQLQPKTDRYQISEELHLTGEAVAYLRNGDRVPLGGIFDVRASVKRALLQGVLSTGEILEIGSTLRACRLTREFLLSEELRDIAVNLYEWGGRLACFPAMEREIERCIDDDGNILDSASAKLHSLRSQSKILQARVREKLDNIVRSGDTAKYLQESLVSIRNQRYVIPVKQEYRSHFPGIVHDQSASGSTLFIEPMVVVEINNQLQLIQNEEQEEQRRILVELSTKIRGIAEALQTSLQILARVDLNFAKAKYSLQIGGVEPELDLEGHLELKEARHPLLGGNVVPTSVSLGGEFDTLVITGPNTGGKTVTLKTVGLLTLMAQSGLHIPALIGSKIAIFEKIFCDIGDEQSIEQSLSTFSAHMTQIVDILKQATDRRCLVLLDELGAGTDPSEGAALAMSILTHLHESGIRTIATTHYSELKAFAYKTSGIQNASVEFNVETLRPTYHLIIGLPGSSQAFEIAAKLGLSGEVIDGAKGYISSDAARVEEMLRDIENERRQAREDRKTAEEARIKAENYRIRYENEINKFNDNREIMLREAKEEARDLLLDARRESENLVRSIKEASSEELNQVANESRKQINEKLKTLEEKPKQPKKHNKSAQQLKVGEQVHLISVGREGTILEIAGNMATVQAGIIKLSLPLDDLARIDSNPKNVGNAKSSKKELRKVGTTGMETAQRITSEINVLGMTVDDALYEVEKYLDQALLAGLKRFRIVHGKGTGALRVGIQQYLRNHPAVSKISIAEQNEGGIGATIVELQ